MNDSKAEAGRAWLDFVDEHGAKDIDDRPPIPPVDLDEVAEAIREAGGLEEIPALYLLDLLAEANRTQRDGSAVQKIVRLAKNSVPALARDIEAVASREVEREPGEVPPVGARPPADGHRRSRLIPPSIDVCMSIST